MATTVPTTEFSGAWHLEDDPYPPSDIVPASESLPIVPIVCQQTYAEFIAGKSCKIKDLKSVAYLKYNGATGMITGDTCFNKDGVLLYHVFLRNEPLSFKFKLENFDVLEADEDKEEDEEEEEEEDEPDLIQENEKLSDENKFLLQDNTSLWQDNNSLWQDNCSLKEQLADSQDEIACLKDQLEALKKKYAHLMVDVPPFVSKNNSISK